jgi:peptidoglycan/LPS O-acetylase OafA/YrhL
LLSNEDCGTAMGAATSNPIAKKIVVPEIDGLRGVAIIAVVLHHLFSQPLTALHLRPLGIPLNPLFGNGWLGVGLRFISTGRCDFCRHTILQQ